MPLRNNNPPEPSWALLRDELVGFVNKRVESSDVAEDIVHDVYLRLQRSEPGSISNPQAWLYRAARNATIDHYRTRRIDDTLDDTESLMDRDQGGGPNDATRELASCLRPLIDQLPVNYRRALALVDIEGNTQADAADIEAISVSGMKSRVQRGRKQLGDLLTNCCQITTDSYGSISHYENAGKSCDDANKSCGC